MARKSRTFFAVLMMAGMATMFVSADAYAVKGDPHHEENDGCDHGKTGKDCRDDPSDKGRDCDKHGQHGGVNEDHCATTTTEGDVTTTTEGDATTTTEGDATTTTEGDATTTTEGDATTTTEGGVVTTTLPGVVVPSPVGQKAPVVLAPPADQLPATGTSSDALAAFAGGLLLFGAGLRRFTTVS